MTLFLTPVLYCVALVESNEYMKGIGKKKKIKIMYGFIYFNYPFALTLT